MRHTTAGATGTRNVVYYGGGNPVPLAVGGRLSIFDRCRKVGHNNQTDAGLQIQLSKGTLSFEGPNLHNDRRFLLDVERETLRATPFVEERRLSRMNRHSTSNFLPWSINKQSAYA